MRLFTPTKRTRKGTKHTNQKVGERSSAGGVFVEPFVDGARIVCVADSHASLASLVGRRLAPRRRQRLEVVRVGERVRTSDDEYKCPHSIDRRA